MWRKLLFLLRWALIGCVFAVLVFVMFAGVATENWGGFSVSGFEFQARYEHGWPMTFRERVGPVGHRFVFWEGEGDVNWLALFADISCLVTGTALLLTLAAYRKFFRRFGFKSLLVLMAIFAIGAWRVSNQFWTCRAEERVAAWLESKGCGVEYSFAGPKWLTRLTGNPFPVGDEFSVVRVLHVAEDFPTPVEELKNKLMQLPHLQELSLSRSNVTDSDLQSLLSWDIAKQLRSLSLDETQISDKALGKIGNCQSLTHISVAYTNVGDKSLNHLRQCRELRSINASGTQLSAGCVASLQALRNLRELQLRNVDIPPEEHWRFEQLALPSLRVTQKKKNGPSEMRDALRDLELEFGL